jgi:hypothetical protein
LTETATSLLSLFLANALNSFIAEIFNVSEGGLIKIFTISIVSGITVKIPS